MKFTARFEGLVDEKNLIAEFSDPRALEDWRPYPEPETKEVCGQMFLGSTLACSCGGRATFEVMDDYPKDGREDWYFKCYSCGRSWKLENVKVKFDKV